VDDEVIETAGLLSIRATNPVFQVLTGPIRDMDIIQDPEHSDGAPTIEGTGIRVEDIAVGYNHIDDFRSPSSETASA
jgi:hypothetical protein